MSRGGLAALAVSLALVLMLASCGGGGCSIPGCQGILPQPAPEKPAPIPRLVEVTITTKAIKMPGTLPPGPTVFNITNSGETADYFEITRLGTEFSYGLDLLPGETGSLALDLQPGKYRASIPFGTSFQKGPFVELTVTESKG